jgi:ergothioneine biosynthesis protein EgtB
MNLLKQYISVRQHSVDICVSLKTEDYVVQPIVDVSPPKWHLGHTTWFFETFILQPNYTNYRVFDPNYNFVFNSYYETVGARVIRTDRGNLSRPSVEDIYAYRKHVDAAMVDFLANTTIGKPLQDLFVLGLNHEQQHQELLLTDIKYILGHNPLFPSIDIRLEEQEINENESFLSIPEGVYEMGFEGGGFCFDNELNRHKVYLQSYQIQERLVTNGTYLEFIKDGGYEKFQYWHADGWEWVNKNKAKAPLYWHLIDGEWFTYSFDGLHEINPNQVVCHINFYEASAFAAWKGMRLPTEAEWEVASAHFQWGQRWEWTNSAYLPYPGFQKAAGAIGEYNGKFMVNQMVLRGGSVATPEGHSRNTYRNFFQPQHRWQFMGIRLAI